MTYPSNPFSLTPLPGLDDVALGQAIAEYGRFIGACRQCRDFPLQAEIEALEQALAEVEEEVLRRGRLLLFLEAVDKAATLEHPLVVDWITRGWQVQTMRPFGNSLQRQVLVRLVASAMPLASSQEASKPDADITRDIAPPGTP